MSMKSTAVAHPIQGLIKYHGLKDIKLRIPFHDSISVCIGALHTATTVETASSLNQDLIIINGKRAEGNEFRRVQMVFDKIRSITGYSKYFKTVTQNSVTGGKGLGFSASGFAALGVAACAALEFDIDYMALSELVRLGAGSATRSLAGSFAIWYADKNGKSYAEPIVEPNAFDFSMVIVPVSASIKTDEAHNEVLSSPMFKARLEHVAKLVKTMKNAIKTGNLATIGRLAEEDSLSLHASTMTGKTHMILWEPETIRIIKAVQQMRLEGIPVWYSIDTGPSVFLNTYTSNMDTVAERLHNLGFSNTIKSKVGGRPFLIDKHLF
ncbi:diphosphomevalonate decarboxylase [Candidatus Bathyarchaeota archaeon]|nr:diphosphomevalonate decarboxylase [Candidatus Bathyarchaeota archaeon]